MVIFLILSLATSIYSVPDCGNIVSEADEVKYSPWVANARRNGDDDNNLKKVERTTIDKENTTKNAQVVHEKFHGMRDTNNMFIDNMGNVIAYKNFRRANNYSTESTMSVDYLSDLITCRKYSPEIALTLKKLNALQQSIDVGTANNMSLANVALIIKGYIEYKITQDNVYNKSIRTNDAENVQSDEVASNSPWPEENELILANRDIVIDKTLKAMKITIENQGVGYRLVDLLYLIIKHLHSAGIINETCKSNQENSLLHSIGLVHSVYLDNSFCAISKYSSGSVRRYVDSPTCASNLKAVLNYITIIIKRFINISECKDRENKPDSRKYISLDVTRRGNVLEDHIKEFPKTNVLVQVSHDETCDNYNNDLHGLWSLISEHIYAPDQYTPNIFDLHSIGLLVKAYLDYEEKDKTMDSQHDIDLPHKNVVIRNLINVIKDSISKGNNDIVTGVVELILDTLTEERLINEMYANMKKNALRHLIYVAYKQYLDKANCFKEDDRDMHSNSKENISETPSVPEGSEEYFRVLKQVFAVENEKKKYMIDCFIAFTEFIEDIKRHIEQLIDDSVESNFKNNQETTNPPVVANYHQEYQNILGNQLQVIRLLKKLIKCKSDQSKHTNFKVDKKSNSYSEIQAYSEKNWLKVFINNNV